MAGLLALILFGLVPGRPLTTPAGLAIPASLTALSALAFRMSLKMEDSADEAHQWARRAIWYEEDPLIVILRLRGVGLRGRPRLRRDIAPVPPAIPGEFVVRLGEGWGGSLHYLAVEPERCELVAVSATAVWTSRRGMRGQTSRRILRTLTSTAGEGISLTRPASRASA